MKEQNILEEILYSYERHGNEDGWAERHHSLLRKYIREVRHLVYEDYVNYIDKINHLLYDIYYEIVDRIKNEEDSKDINMALSILQDFLICAERYNRENKTKVTEKEKENKAWLYYYLSDLYFRLGIVDIAIQYAKEFLLVRYDIDPEVVEGVISNVYKILYKSYDRKNLQEERKRYFREHLVHKINDVYELGRHDEIKRTVRMLLDSFPDDKLDGVNDYFEIIYYLMKEGELPFDTGKRLLEERLRELEEIIRDAQKRKDVSQQEKINLQQEKENTEERVRLLNLQLSDKYRTIDSECEEKLQSLFGELWKTLGDYSKQKLIMADSTLRSVKLGIGRGSEIEIKGICKNYFDVVEKEINFKIFEPFRKYIGTQNEMDQMLYLKGLSNFSKHLGFYMQGRYSSLNLGQIMEILEMIKSGHQKHPVLKELRNFINKHTNKGILLREEIQKNMNILRDFRNKLLVHDKKYMAVTVQLCYRCRGIVIGNKSEGILIQFLRDLR